MTPSGPHTEDLNWKKELFDSVVVLLGASLKT